MSIYFQSMNRDHTNVPFTRIYQPVSLQIHSIIQLDENGSHHVARVLRANVGDSIILFNGEGGEYQADIRQINKKFVEVEIISFHPRNTESSIEIFLAQGIARGEKMDFIVQKAVELGVKKIFPLITERCNVRLAGEREEKRLRHWRSIIISACEQSGRNFIPEIFPPQTLGAWLEHIKADLCFVLSPHVEDKFPSANITVLSSVALIIGSEGGLSEKEISLVQQKNFLPINLGPRILRTETATIAALAALQMRYGDLT